MIKLEYNQRIFSPALMNKIGVSYHDRGLIVCYEMGNTLIGPDEDILGLHDTETWIHAPLIYKGDEESPLKQDIIRSTNLSLLTLCGVYLGRDLTQELQEYTL